MAKNLLTRTILAISLVNGLAGLARAADGPPADTKPWKNNTEASVVSTNGNSKATTTSIKDTFNYKWTKTGLEINGAGLGSSSGNQVTAEQYLGNEKVTYNYTERNYVYQKFGWDKNRFAGIRNRWDTSAGIGRILLDFANDKLNGEVGGGYINEERSQAARNEFASGRVYSKYVHTFSATAFFSQDAEYLHNFKNSDDYRLNTETALTAALSTHLSLKTSFVWNRLGKPAPGIGKDDTKVIAGLIITY